MGDRVTSKWMLVERVRYIVKDFGEKNKDFGEKIKIFEKKKDFKEKIKMK